MRIFFKHMSLYLYRVIIILTLFTNNFVCIDLEDVTQQWNDFSEVQHAYENSLLKRYTNAPEKDYEIELITYKTKISSVSYYQLVFNQENTLEERVNALIKQYAFCLAPLDETGEISVVVNSVINISNKNIISITYSVFGLFEGSVPPRETTWAVNIDLNTGNLLKLSDLFIINNGLLTNLGISDIDATYYRSPDYKIDSKDFVIDEVEPLPESRFYSYYTVDGLGIIVNGSNCYVSAKSYVTPYHKIIRYAK